MKSISILFKFGVAGALLFSSMQSMAHHSYAMFDRQTTRSYQGVVRTWEFTNPHATLWVYINDAEGKPQLWGLEAPGPSTLTRNGWNKNTVKPGDRISVDINPLRDGRNGGNLVKLTASDGRVLEIGALPGAPGGTSVVTEGPDASKEAPKK